MKEIIEIELFGGISKGKKWLVDAITDAVKDNESDFKGVMAATCLKYNPHAEVLDGLEVGEVVIDESGDTGYVEVEYEWDVYFGCDDLAIQDIVSDNWGFQIQGTEVVFQLEVPEIERTDEI